MCSRTFRSMPLLARLPTMSGIACPIPQDSCRTSSHGLASRARGGCSTWPAALVASFQEIWAIDLEPEMIAVGQHEATQRGVHHITWMVGKAEDLAAPPAS